MLTWLLLDVTDSLVREYVVEIITQPTGHAMDDVLKMNLSQHIPAGFVSVGLSADGHLAVRFDVDGTESPDQALTLGLEIFKMVMDHLDCPYVLRKLTVGPHEEFDD